MFPQSSYNTPHGYQFGREEAIFTEETGINPDLWDEALTEQGFEETHEDSRAVAPVEQELSRAIAATSQIEAKALAAPIEQSWPAERNEANRAMLTGVDQRIRFYRDHAGVRETEPVAQEAFSFNMFKSKEQKHVNRVARMSERQLIQAESELGKTIFGPVPKDSRREFFNLDEDTWIWHEEWVNDSKKKEFRTTRYELRGTDVIKSQDGEKRTYVSGRELENLATAARYYHDVVARAVYHRDPITGRKLVDIL